MRQIVVLCSCLLYFKAISQDGFYVDTTLLSGQSIKLIDLGNSEGVVITSKDEVFLLSEDLWLTDLTSRFTDFSDADFISVAYVDNNLFFVGTDSDSLLVYRDGSVSQIGSRQGLTASEVNSMRVEGDRLLLGTEKRRFFTSYLFNSFEIADFEDSPERRVELLSPNHYTTMYKVNNDPYCGNLSNLELVNYYATGVAVAGVNTHESLIEKEKVKDALMLGGGSFIWNNSSFLYGSNYALRWSDLCAWDGSYVTIIDSTAINDLLLFNLYRQFDFPNIIYVAADNGAYFVENIYDRAEMKATKIADIGNVKVNCLAIKDAVCDFSVWMGTDAGLIKYTSPPWDVSYTRRIQEYYERLWCKDDFHQMRPISSALFDYQWLKDGEAIPGATSGYLSEFEPGFYQLVYQNCHMHDTLDVATYILDRNVDADIRYSSTTGCTNDYLNLYVESDYTQTYEWYKNDELIPDATSRSYRPVESGFYKVKATNCNDISAVSSSIAISIYPTEEPLLDPASVRDHYCEGDTIKLLPPNEEVSIAWSRWNQTYSAFDDEQYIILSKDIEPNRVKFTTSNGCVETLTLPYMSVYEKPEMVLTEDTITICDDIPVTFEFYNYANEVIWSDGQTTNYWRNFDSAGVYTAYTLSYRGCESDEDTLVVEQYYSPVFSLMNDTTLTFGDSITILGPEGYNEYYWNGRLGEKDFLFKPAKSGLFNVELELTNGKCRGVDRVQIQVVDPKVMDLAKMPFGIYPNPTKDHIHISSAGALFINYRVISLSGKDVTSYTTEHEENTLNIARLKPGIYFILIDGYDPVKFIKSPR